MKKLLTLAAIVAIALTATNASARLFGGTTYGGDGTWQGANNWSDDWTGPAPTPDAATPVDIIDVGGNVTVAASGAVAGSVNVGVNGWNGRIDVAVAGDLSVAGNMLFQSSAGFTGTVVNEGQITIGGLTAFQDGLGILENNGTFNNTGDIYLANNGASDTTLINTGSITAGTLFLSVAGTSQFDMNGGAVDVSSFQMVEGGIGHLNLHGGTITTSAFGLNGNGGYTIDVTGTGTLIADGDHTGGLDFMIGAGLITGDAGLDAVYDIGTGKTTLSVIPEPATLSMVALLGGGMLWIRKRFTI